MNNWNWETVLAAEKFLEEVRKELQNISEILTIDEFLKCFREKVFWDTSRKSLDLRHSKHEEELDTIVMFNDFASLSLYVDRERRPDEVSVGTFWQTEVPKHVIDHSISGFIFSNSERQPPDQINGLEKVFMGINSSNFWSKAKAKTFYTFLELENFSLSYIRSNC